MPNLTPTSSQALHNHEAAFYRLLVKNLPQTAVIVFDTALRYIAAEGQFLNSFGFSQEQMLGKTIWEVLSPEGATALEPHYRAVLEGKDVHFERVVENYTYAAHIVPVKDEQGNIFAGMIVAQDITEKKQQEELFRQAEKMYRSLFEYSMDAILLTEPNGNILMVNGEACRIFGRTEMEIREQGRDSLVDVTDPRLQQALEEGQRTGQFRGELTLLRSDGTPFPAYISTKVFGEPDKLRTSMIIRDLTEVKSAEERKKELLLERERVNILTQFIETASHDLRTPLSVIQSSAYLAGKISDPQIQRKHFDNIEKTVAHLNELVEAMLVMVKLDTYPMFEFKPVEINRLIREVFSSLVKAINNKRLHMQYDLEEKLPRVLGDYEQLTVAVLNVARNAVQHTPGGTIYVKSQSTDTSVIIDILDSGPGVPEKELPRIFERFYRVDKARSMQTGGAGLGLSIARSIVERHGGTIEVSNQDTGLLVRITLSCID